MPTPKTIYDVVASVCHIPIEFHERGDVSVVTLLIDSGYPELRASIGVTHIQRYLQAHPDILDAWATYSEDKRCEGWYFVDDRCAIGADSSCVGTPREQVFGERSEACASFIKHELDSIIEHTG
jgi:hypothetical protein